MWVDWVDRALRPDAEAAVEPGDVPLWWPWVKGERVPLHDRSLRVALAGADISQGPEALRRAAFEATGFAVRHIVELAEASGTSPQRFVLSGGGVRNRDWLQAIADVLGVPVVPVAFPDGAALGSAFLARMALGAESSLDDATRWAKWSPPVGPRPAWASAAHERYERWKSGLPEGAPRVAQGSTAAGFDRAPRVYAAALEAPAFSRRRQVGPATVLLDDGFVRRRVGLATDWLGEGLARRRVG